MKKFISLLLSVSLFSAALTACAADNVEERITLQIGNPNMTVNGESMEIDPGRGTVPIVQNERTLIPVRALIEAMGGTVDWDEASQTAALTYGTDEIRLVIGSTTAYLNNEVHTLDVEPVVINERTMLPVRFIAEGFGFDVDWNGDDQMITITKANSQSSEEITPTTAPTTAPTQEPVSDTVNSSETKVKITVGDQELTATLYDNPTSRAFIDMLPVTLPMLDLYGNEMCYRFDDALPTDDVQSRGYEVGEIIYWPPRHSFVIRYSQNGEVFDMQSIGRVDSGVDIFNGIGDTDVTFELMDNSGQSTAQNNANAGETDITLTINGKQYPAVLYDNATSRQLIAALPHTVSLGRGNRDYCGDINLGTTEYDEADVQNGYQNGDLVYWLPGDDFVIFRTGEETADSVSDCVVIGRLLEGLNEIENMGGSIEVTIDLAK